MYTYVRVCPFAVPLGGNRSHKTGKVQHCTVILQAGFAHRKG